MYAITRRWRQLWPYCVACQYQCVGESIALFGFLAEFQFTSRCGRITLTSREVGREADVSIALRSLFSEALNARRRGCGSVESWHRGQSRQQPLLHPVVVDIDTCQHQIMAGEQGEALAFEEGAGEFAGFDEQALQAEIARVCLDGGVEQGANAQALGIRCDVQHVQVAVGFQVGEAEHGACLVLCDHHDASVAAACCRARDIGRGCPCVDLLGRVRARSVASDGADVEIGQRGRVSGSIGAERGHAMGQ